MAGELRYRDAGLSIDERTDDLLGRMTLEEKLAQLGSCWSFEVLDGAEFDREKAHALLGQGLGQITRVAGATNLSQREVAALANRIQRFLVEETRLGIPAIVHEECLHGLLARESVCYPQSIGQAATWDPSLVKSMAARLGRQLRAAGAQQGLAPIFDITRDPRWGRAEETYGEDPYLVAALASAYTEGLQGEGGDGSPLPAAERVFATAKHMVGHGLPEGGLNHAPAHIGDRELYDEFLFPFEAGVRGAGLRSIMHAYDEIDGVPCVASKELFTTILRDRWGFDGIVVSDYFGIEQLVTAHKVSETMAGAGARALEAGIDVELPTTIAYGEPLRKACEAGLVDEALIDVAVRRMLRAKFELGLFDSPYVDEDGATPDLAEDRELAREIAHQSIVLVKNDGVLPVPDSLGSIAVIGPNADSARNLLGDYAHLVHIETLLDNAGFGSATETPTGLSVADELAGIPTILDAIRRRVLPGTRVTYARGCGVQDGDDAELDEAVRVAAAAELAIVVVGERSGLTSDCTSGEARDRMSLGLLGRQPELVARVAATGTPVVLLVVAGRPQSIEPEAAVSRAALYCWVPGESGPDAIADVLFGDANPGGKLPITIARNAGQVPIYYAHKPSGGKSNWKIEYVDGSNEPLYPFGFGLSYATFALSDLEISPRQIASTAVDETVSVSLRVENTGDRPGDEVVQLYLRDPEAEVTRPVKELRGFARIRLSAGECRRVTFRLSPEQLAYTGIDGALVVDPGRIVVMVGTSSAALPLTGEFLVTGAQRRVADRTRYFTAVDVA